MYILTLFTFSILHFITPDKIFLCRNEEKAWQSTTSNKQQSTHAILQESRTINNNNNMLYMYWELGRLPLNLYYTYMYIWKYIGQIGSRFYTIVMQGSEGGCCPV